MRVSVCDCVSCVLCYSCFVFRVGFIIRDLVELSAGVKSAALFSVDNFLMTDLHGFAGTLAWGKCTLR